MVSPNTCHLERDDTYVYIYIYIHIYTHTVILLIMITIKALIITLLLIIFVWITILISVNSNNRRVYVYVGAFQNMVLQSVIILSIHTMQFKLEGLKSQKHCLSSLRNASNVHISQGLGQLFQVELLKAGRRRNECPLHLERDNIYIRVWTCVCVCV